MTKLNFKQVEFIAALQQFMRDHHVYEITSSTDGDVRIIFNGDSACDISFYALQPGDIYNK